MIKQTNVAIFASGNGSNFHAIVTQWRAEKSFINKIILITNRPNAKVIGLAQNLHIPYFIIPLTTTKIVMEQAMLTILKTQAMTFIVLAGYMTVISAQFLDDWSAWVGNEQSIINLHPSLLPLLKGEPDAVNQAWLQKYTVTGITIHYVIAELDGGDIIFQATYQISAHDTLESLRYQIQQLEHRHYWPIIKQVLMKK